MVVEYKVLVHGPAVQGDGALPSAAGAILLRLENALHGSVDVAFRRSSASGRRQQWLREAAQVRFEHAEKKSADELAFYFTAPKFGDVAQVYFSQQRMFDDGPNAEETAFDTLAHAVTDVLSSKADSDTYDTGLLKRFCKFETSVFDKHVEELVISGSRISLKAPVRISRALPVSARELFLNTPQPNRARVAGKLDMIEASTMAFALMLPGGEKVRGVWKGSEFETLRKLVNSDVVATGTAVYRPSGTLLRLDADLLTQQSVGDQLFTKMPTPIGARLDIKSLAADQRKRGGVSALWGKLPAEESDDEFLAAISEMD